MGTVEELGKAGMPIAEGLCDTCKAMIAQRVTEKDLRKGIINPGWFYNKVVSGFCAECKNKLYDAARSVKHG